jgi:pimeloyl-ACP methyl ester carboxylesterase
LTAGQVNATLGALVMPTLLLLAREGLGGRHSELESMARQSIPGLQLDNVPGGHHFHMESSAGAVAARVKEFMQT